jgi:TctA family transporter
VLPALAQLLSGAHFLHLIAGVLVGLTVGLLPGLGGIAGLSIVLPFVYGMDPAAALAMMIGLTSVTTTSDTFPSVLLAIPGSAGSQATVLDGFPLAKKGEAARALGAAFSASLFGGIFGALVLTVAIFFAQPLLLAIGFGEQLLLVVLALTLVGMLTGPSVLKGLASCGLGLLLGTVGASSSTAEYRLTFDTIYLSDGLPLVVIGLGMFAFPEIVDALRRQGAISESGALGHGWLQGFKDTIRHKWLMLRFYRCSRWRAAWAWRLGNRLDRLWSCAANQQG